jgi:hypothetical protein
MGQLLVYSQWGSAQVNSKYEPSNMLRLHRSSLVWYCALVQETRATGKGNQANLGALYVLAFCFERDQLTLCYIHGKQVDDVRLRFRVRQETGAIQTSQQYELK